MLLIDGYIIGIIIISNTVGGLIVKRDFFRATFTGRYFYIILIFVSRSFA